MRLELGKPVRTSDGDALGELADVIIDPLERRVTHLVVASKGGVSESRLVPIELADGDEGDQEITLRCDAEAVRQLPNVHEFEYVRLGVAQASDPEWDVGITTVLALPYFDGGMSPYAGAAVATDYAIAYDRVPKGEVEIRRASSVLSADGRHVGDVDGFLVDGEGGVTHLVLERGHLWGRREITVPIGAVKAVSSDTVSVQLSTDEIDALPAHKVHRWPVLHRNA